MNIDTNNTDRHIKISYTIIDEESASNGDYKKTGWIEETGISCEPDEFNKSSDITAVDTAVRNLKHAGAINFSSSFFDVHGWYSNEPEMDFRTGETEERSFHLYNFSEEELREIYKQIMEKN